MNILIRKAERKDVFDIHRLVSEASLDDDSLLYRSIKDINYFLDTFLVGEVDGVIAGCVAVHSYSRDLCEVRSHVVDPNYRGKGVGIALLRQALAQAKKQFPKIWMDAKKISMLVDLFGFEPISRTKMPFSVLLVKLRWVFNQDFDRWVPSLTGRFTLLELKG